MEANPRFPTLHHSEGLVVKGLGVRSSKLDKEGGAKRGTNKGKYYPSSICVQLGQNKKARGCSKLLWTLSEPVPGTAERHRVDLFPHCNRCPEAQGTTYHSPASFSEAGTLGALTGT